MHRDQYRQPSSAQQVSQADGLLEGPAPSFLAFYTAKPFQWLGAPHIHLHTNLLLPAHKTNPQGSGRGAHYLPSCLRDHLGVNLVPVEEEGQQQQQEGAESPGGVKASGGSGGGAAGTDAVQEAEARQERLRQLRERLCVEYPHGVPVGGRRAVVKESSAHPCMGLYSLSNGAQLAEGHPLGLIAAGVHQHLLPCD